NNGWFSVLANSSLHYKIPVPTLKSNITKL
ncbi:MAG: hypothetical protein ACJAY1_001865, partial [Glaciecola sp.]